MTADTSSLPKDSQGNQVALDPISPGSASITASPVVSATTTPQQHVSSTTQTSGPPLPTLEDNSGVVLGLQALERQQQQQQQRYAQTVARTMHVQQEQQQQQQQRRVFTDDDTDPSSTPSGDARSTDASTLEEENHSSFGRFIQNTRKRLSSREYTDPAHGGPMVHHTDRDISIEELWDSSTKHPLISGYLHKFGRNGKWQRRFFETDGVSLSYYKSESRHKMLATLDLCKVGKIALDPTDSAQCMFCIQVADRPYNLRAETKAMAKDWVITLNRIKEARMQLGHVKLVENNVVRKPGESDEFKPRVVLVANRERLHALGGEDVQSWEDLVAEQEVMKLAESEYVITSSVDSAARSKRFQRAVLARWQKRHSSLSRLGLRLVKWARSVKGLSLKSCKDAPDQVILDQRVHPPGHEIPRMHDSAESSGPSDPSKTSGISTITSGRSSSTDADDDEGETRELA